MKSSRGASPAWSGASLAHSVSSAPWAWAVWGRSIAPATASWVATWRSSCCRRISRRDPERRARFAREARLLATLNHPHIGAIYGLEEMGGETALVLELVEGATLAEHLERGPLPVSDAVTVARQVAEALEAAHDKGIVHRDLKPTNIVLQSVSGPSGVPSGAPRAKVLDFGLAKTMAVGLDADRPPDPSKPVSGTADGRILGRPPT